MRSIAGVKGDVQGTRDIVKDFYIGQPAVAELLNVEPRLPLLSGQPEDEVMIRGLLRPIGDQFGCLGCVPTFRALTST